MLSSNASFRNIYNHVGNSITISSIDKVSLNKTRGKETTSSYRRRGKVGSRPTKWSSLQSM